MATKKISDLSLRSDFDETCNLPADDASQTWRVTGEQMKAFILEADGSTLEVSSSAMRMKDGGTTRAKLALGAVAKVVAQTKTTTFTASTDDDVYLCSASAGAYSATLPAAAGCAGKIFTFKRTDDTPANALTLDGNASETIGGSTTVALYTKNETLEIMSDGTNWVILEHRWATALASYSPTLTNWGTTSNVSAFWQRISPDSVRILAKFTTASPSGAATGRLGLPFGTIDSTKVPTVRTLGLFYPGAAADGNFPVLGTGGDNYVHFGRQNATNNGLTSALAGNGVGNGNTVTFDCIVPITGLFG